ncbi:amidohydrolase [Sphingobacteriales bacterium UPWRP_1]|nr:amidohydrolase [Sphingobacteriales bacterium TSM_CSM]PSJ75892.1 amidohydrolase [Sphingobacteriales bacterium UPWRP_1]
MKKIFTLLGAALLIAVLYPLQAQPTFNQNYNGVHDEREGLYAITGATVYTQYNQKTENATLLIRKGIIEAVGTNIAIPQGAVVIEAKGKFIYPSFIDLYSNYGMPDMPKREGGFDGAPQTDSKKKGAYNWNQAIKPEFNASENFTADDKRAKEYRNLGFGMVLTHQTDGIARGSGTLVLLKEGKENELVVKDRASANYSFSKGSSTQDYPSSQMGVIALLRQTYYDAQWYAKTKPGEEEYNISLDAWNKLQGLPQVFEVSDKLEALRADKIGDEFGVQYLMKGSGNEYQRTDELKATGAGFILPLNFPDAYDVENPFDAMNVELSKMKHWELAPSNPQMLAKAGITIALTTYGLKDMGQFAKNLRKAIKRGLSPEEALKALTFTPANLLGVYNQTGSLEKGKLANFIITSKPVFDEKAELHENWVKGARYVLKSMEVTDITGIYTLNVGSVAYNIEVSGEPGAAKATILLPDTTKKIEVKHSMQNLGISLSFVVDSLNESTLGKGTVRLSGWVNTANKSWKGSGTDANGKWIEFTASRTADAPKKDEGTKPEEKKDDNKPDNKDNKSKTNAAAGNNDGKDAPKAEKPEELGTITYPFTAYGWTQKPQNQTVLFKNATVWTNEAEGILQNTDVLIQNGKIAAIGKNLPAPKDGQTVDAKGKHLTCGIIDEHSHIAISKGVNEGTQASSAEVSIATVVNSEDINIYRHLAGGVTTIQQLHGSANPIGGQSSVIKLRWGLAPDALKLEGAPGFIKFALGENVKQSNWGDFNTTRFPQSRMGVEQVYVDAFTRAREYGNALKTASGGKKGASGKPVRRDLELDALLEILESKRFITCHSYVQSEITMLMRVAEQFGFKVNTFTHILEGYKVADKMKNHGVSASSFSDWWAYKFEVKDAIPYNGAILNSMGVNTGFNSDDAEMARRLNQEAAKAVKYGGVSEEDAWKFVTLNPAKMLHIDNHVGSIKKGKDADVVLWSDNPLSIYALPVQTYVDGVKYFDAEQDLQLRSQIDAERNRLIQKMLSEKAKGGDMQKPMPSKRRLYHCTDLGDGEYIDFYHEDANEH